MHRIRLYEFALALSVLALLAVAGAGRPHDAGQGSFLGPPRLALPDSVAFVPPVPSSKPVKAELDEAALDQGLPASLIEAVAYWESGWDQSRVSATGAIGLMQVQPETEADVATRLLGHRADLHDPADNSQIGAAILRSLLRDFGGDTGLALAAYYQGEAAVRSDGLYPDTQQYVAGIQALAARFAQGEGPPVAN